MGRLAARALNKIVENLAQIEPSESDLIYLAASNRLLWLGGEVGGFRQDYVASPCTTCGSRWRETGYLKRRSLVPDHVGRPELSQTLRNQEERVYVEFCPFCGRMESRVVENRPPFRTKNTLYRDERKAVEAIRRRYAALRVRALAQEPNEAP